MAISYNAGTNTITLDGVNTYTLTNIYNADVAGGWGVVTQYGDISYLFECHLIVGSGSDITQLVDTGKTFQLATNAARKDLQVTVNSILDFSKCFLTFYLLSYPNWEKGELKFENCGILLKGTVGGFFFENKVTMKHTIVIGSGGMTIYWQFVSGIIEDVTIDGLTQFGLRSENLVVNDIKIKNMDNGLTVYNYDIMATARNIVFSGNTKDLWIWGSELPRATFIDCDFDSTKMTFQFNGNYLDEKYTFNVLIIDKDNNPLENVSVILRDKNRVIKHTGLTNAAGKLTSTWDVQCNNFKDIALTKTESNPYSLSLIKTGYITDERIVTIDEKSRWVITLKKRERDGILSY